MDSYVSYESARMVAVNIWNSQGRVLRTMVKDPADIIPFPWDKNVRGVKKQSLSEMKNIMMGIARVHNRRLEKKDK